MIEAFIVAGSIVAGIAIFHIGFQLGRKYERKKDFNSDYANQIFKASKFDYKYPPND